MNSHKLKLAMALLTVFCCVQLVHAQSSQPLAIIVNKSNTLDNLRQSELRRILLGERKYWKDSEKITLLMPKEGSPERESTLEILRMNEADYRKHWLGKVNAGEADGQPISLPAAGTAVSLVSGASAAIAIIPLAAVRGSVKVLKIDGKLPTDPDYQLN